MATEATIEPQAPPGHGEGQALDLLDPRDVGLLRQAIRRGWIKSLARMDAMLAAAVEAAKSVADPELKARLADAHARTAATIASVYTRSVAVAEGQQAAQVTNNTQINVGADLSKLTVEQLRALAGNDQDPDQA